MNIQRFAARLGISVYTLRYYEKMGLISVARLHNGHRFYSEQDVVWVQFIQRLKDTGMPLVQIQAYALARIQGDETLGIRKVLLEQHAKSLQQMLIQQQYYLQKLNEKIESYQVSIAAYEVNKLKSLDSVGT